MKTKPMLNQEPEITLHKADVRHLLETRVIMLQLSVVCSDKDDYEKSALTIAGVLEKFSSE